jgi:hypothetical protein
MRLEDDNYVGWSGRNWEGNGHSPHTMYVFVLKKWQNYQHLSQVSLHEVRSGHRLFGTQHRHEPQFSSAHTHGNVWTALGRYCGPACNSTPTTRTFLWSHCLLQGLNVRWPLPPATAAPARPRRYAIVHTVDTTQFNNNNNNNKAILNAAPHSEWT